MGKIQGRFKSAAEWCKENWKSIVKIVAAAVIITGLGIAAALTGGYWELYWQEHSGEHWPVDDRRSGRRIAAAINGGSFLEGFADGALSGAISGAVIGAACAGLVLWEQRQEKASNA